QAEITDTMLVLGQVIVAVMPLSVFFLVRHGTRSDSAGLFAVILAAFGWYMPAHAVDWGKYPALASLALIPFVLGVAYLSIQNRNSLSPPGFWTQNGILFAGLLVSVFLHSRSLIVFIILALTWLITSVYKKFSKLAQILLLGITILVLVLEIFHVQTLGILGPLFDPYGVKAALVTVSVLFLSVFAYLAYPGLVFSCLVAIALFVASLFIPLGDLIPGYANTTLLDRPYVEMILYLPLTLLGGFGLAGLEQKLAGKKLTWGNTQFELAKIMGGFFIAVVAIIALFKYDPYPADCCDIVSDDDLQAIGWMDENLPRDAIILTASTELKVLPTDEFQGSAGGDAGTWITPLIGRPAALMPFNTDFNQAQIHDTLCQLQVDYVYVGGTGWGFNDQGMSAQPEGYRLVFSVPKAKVYEVGGCE
ncbi:MAG TPA: hypothetical protein VJ785_13620, partial [Anaerolineales bacterium]|nr:hypothetical protein [Anaerolineales bacterium]